MRRNVTLKEMHSLQLDMLKLFDKICRKNNLRYSLGGGTLLGAIRHKGFIPWDDDIDVMMPRPDYDRFLKLYKSIEGSSHIKLMCYETDKSYYFPFAKLYDNRTVLIEGGAKNGVYIDIFPIDGLPSLDKFTEYAEQFKQLKIDLCRTNRFYGFDLHKNHLLLFIKYLVKCIIYPSRATVIKRIKQFYQQYPFEISEFAGALSGIYGEKEHMTSETFKYYTNVNFEGETFMAIANYDDYLTKHYGDYMILPPKENRMAHPHIVYWK